MGKTKASLTPPRVGGRITKYDDIYIYIYFHLLPIAEAPDVARKLYEPEPQSSEKKRLGASPKQVMSSRGVLYSRESWQKSVGRSVRFPSNFFGRRNYCSVVQGRDVQS